MRSRIVLLVKVAIVAAMGAVVWQPRPANAALPCTTQVFCSNSGTCADLDDSVCDDCLGGIIWHCDPAGTGGPCDGWNTAGYCGFATK